MKEISLALGGGGVRGIAHLGVIRALTSRGYKIKAVAGTSAGGIIGGLFVAGISDEGIRAFIHQAISNHRKFQRARQDPPSLLGLEGFQDDLADLLGDLRIEDLPICFAATAVDEKTGHEIILNKGRLVDAIRATIAVPGIFPAHRLGTHELVDGAILDPVPARLARWLAPHLPVVAVCLTPPPEHWAEVSAITFPQNIGIPHPILDTLSRIRYTQAFQIFTNSMDISARMLAELRMQLDQPEVIIRPDVAHIGLLDTVDPDELIRLGETASAAAVVDLDKAFALRKRLHRTLTRAEMPGISIDEDSGTRQ